MLTEIDIELAGGALAQNVATLRNTGVGSGVSTAANYTAFTTLFGTATARNKILLDRDTYDIGSATLTFGLSNVYVKGVRGGSTFTTSAKTLLDIGSVSDVVFEDINFVSTSTATGDDSVNALLRWLNVTSRRCTFIRCKFYIPTANANAIKAICPSGSYLTESIYFYDCLILGAGRMGVEIDNTNLSDTVSRHFDWKWIGGSIKNTGLVASQYGHGFSVTGFAEEIEIDTRFDNNKGIGVEFVGACNSRVTGRLTNIVSSSGGVGGTSAIAFMRNAYLNTARDMTDNVVTNFIADDGTAKEVRFWGQDRLVTSGNYFKLNPGTGGTGDVTYVGSKNCKSVGDRYDCAGSFTLEIRTDRNNGGASYNNTWADLTVNHSRAGSPAYLITCVGEGTDNNIINGLSYSPASPTESLIGSVSETDLTASISGNTLTVTAQSGYSPIVVGQTLWGVGVVNSPTITAFGTGTGGVGTYTISGPGQTLSSGALSAGRANKNFLAGRARRSDGFDFVQRTLSLSSDADLNSMSDTLPTSVSVPSLLINSVLLTATRKVYLPSGFSPMRITNGTTGGQSITISDRYGGTSVTIANGATTTVASTSTGFIALA